MKSWRCVIIKKLKIYILLTHSGSVLSKCINIYTKEPYTHVSISLDEGLNEMYSFGRLRPNNPISAGFVREDIVNGTYKRFPGTMCALYSIDIDKIQYKNLKIEIKKFEKNGKKYSYNLIGFVGFVVNYPIERKHSYFCSQFVSTLLNSSGIELINKPTALTSPRDFRECRDLSLIYEGNLQSYNLERSYL